MRITRKMLLKYKNPDKRCTYPFQPEPLGYCWGYATKVDAGATKEEIEKFCKGCDMWKDDKKEAK